MIADVENFITTLETAPAFQTDVAALLADLPASVIQAAESDPEVFLDNLHDSQTLPAYVSAIPTSVIDSLETLAAKPIKAVEDVEAYISSLIAEPEVSSVFSVLMTAVPTSVQEAFETAPVVFFENLITATALPSWVTDIPAPLQSDIGSVVNKGLSIIAADLEGTATSTLASTGLVPSVTATGSVVGTNGTSPSSSPIPFVGAAAPGRMVVVGAAALIAGVGFLIVL